MSFLARDVLDAEPLEIDIGLDDVEQRELALRAQRPACGKGETSVLHIVVMLCCTVLSMLEIIVGMHFAPLRACDCRSDSRR